VGRMQGKVVFVTGAGRGQGRAHAVRFAEEGADIIAADICENLSTVPYHLSREDDLRETGALVRALGRRAVTRVADVRDYESLAAALAEGVAELGSVDVVIANAGIVSFGAVGELPEQSWQDVIDVNLTGVFHTCKAAIPHLSDGGSMVLTSSVAGLKGFANCGHYVAAKHGLVGLMRTLATELAPRRIRVNSVHPTEVDTAMIQNDAHYRLFRPDLEAPGREDFEEAARTLHLLPIAWTEPLDIANAALFLASDEARYITGVALPVDAGMTTRT
jgi:(+)-trans-carveol dehydrogenase